MRTVYDDDPEYLAELARIMSRIGAGSTVRRRRTVLAREFSAPVIVILVATVLIAILFAAYFINVS